VLHLIARSPTRAGADRRAGQEPAARSDGGPEARIARDGADGSAQARAEEGAEARALGGAQPGRTFARGPRLLGRPLATDHVVGLKLFE
jgi:hypothetical protein